MSAAFTPVADTTVVGQIASFEKRRTGQGAPWMALTVDALPAPVVCLILPRMYQADRGLVDELAVVGQVVTVTGRIDDPAAHRRGMQTKGW